MKIKFAHLEHERTIYDWQGSQIAAILFDELCHFSSNQFFYMLSRLRSTSGVPGYVRATCNPDADSWVRGFIDWWIDDEGYPIPERSGKLRWYIRRDEDLFWADTRQELLDRYGADELPKSVTFIPSKLQDNAILMEKDPSYLANLKSLSRVERMRLLGGNWNVKESAGSFFQKEWFPIIDFIPGGWIAAVRFWDRACLIANTQVLTIHGYRNIEDIKVGELVLTRKGFKKVLWAGISKTTNELISVVFSNGTVISGTTCHPVYTNNRGWIKLGELTGDDTVLCESRSLTGRDIASMAPKDTSSMLGGMGSKENTSISLYTGMCGNSIMEVSPTAILSTTRTETGLTTQSKILNASPEKNMDSYIWKTDQEAVALQMQRIERKHSQLFQLGHKNLKNINVKDAENCFTQEALKRNIVVRDATSLGIISAKSVERVAKRDTLKQNIAVSSVLTAAVPVYDLSVEECPEFFANGILVHNSTKPHEGNKDPDWTRGLLLYKYPNNTFVVADLKSMRDTPGQVENFIKNVASHDSTSVRVMSQQDPGSAGVGEAENFVRMLAGYDVRTVVLSKDKVTRAKPVSAQAEVGNIKVLRAPSWNGDFFTELENFPVGAHDDVVDVLSGSFNELTTGGSIIDVFHHMR